MLTVESVPALRFFKWNMVILSASASVCLCFICPSWDRKFLFSGSVQEKKHVLNLVGHHLRCLKVSEITPYSTEPAEDPCCSGAAAGSDGLGSPGHWMPRFVI